MALSYNCYKILDLAGLDNYGFVLHKNNVDGICLGLSCQTKVPENVCCA